MKLPFTLKINGGPELRLQELRMSLNSVRLVSLQTDTASLTWTRRNSGSLCPIVDGDTIDIMLQGRRLFQGRALVQAVDATAMGITLRGPWSHFDDYYWQVNAVTGGPIGGGSSIIASYDGVFTSKMPMFGPTTTIVGGVPVTIASMPIKTQLEQILTYARANIDPDILPGTGNAAAGLRDFPAKTAIKRQVADLRISEAIRQCLASQPDVACWWTYDVAGLPVINFRAASLEVPVSLAIGKEPVLRYQLDQLPELKPATVMVAYEAAAGVSGRAQRFQLDRFPVAGNAASLQPGTLMLTQTVSATPVPGAAATVHDSMNQLRTAGQVTLFDPRFNLGLRPGMTLDITGDNVLSASPVQHWVQEVTWNPAGGQASCTVGYPQAMGLEETLDLQRYFRRCIRGFDPQ